MSVHDFRRHGARDAFSLIEIVLAIGIIAFALVGILGLFPVALDSAVSSQRETQIALIARSIYADFLSTRSGKAFVPTSSSTTTGIAIDLSSASTRYLGYDTEGQILGEMSNGDYASGNGSLAFIARVEVLPKGTDSGLSQVNVTIGVPAAASADQRRSYAFACVLDQQVPQNVRIGAAEGLR